jgi:hypothetical protein
LFHLSFYSFSLLHLSAYIVLPFTDSPASFWDRRYGSYFERFIVTMTPGKVAKYLKEINQSLFVMVDHLIPPCTFYIVVVHAVYDGCKYTGGYAYGTLCGNWWTHHISDR